MMKRVNRKGQDEEEKTNEIITEEDIAQQALKRLRCKNARQAISYR